MACPACAARGYSNTGRANDARARAADPDFRYGRQGDPAWPNQAERLRGISDCSRKSSEHIQHDADRTSPVELTQQPEPEPAVGCPAQALFVALGPLTNASVASMIRLSLGRLSGCSSRRGRLL